MTKVQKNLVIIIAAIVFVNTLIYALTLILLDTFMISQSKIHPSVSGYIKSNPEIIRQIGEVKRYKRPSKAEYQIYDNGTREVKFTIKVIGEKKNVTAYFEMEKSSHGDWEVVYFSYK